MTLCSRWVSRQDENSSSAPSILPVWNDWIRLMLQWQSRLRTNMNFTSSRISRILLRNSSSVSGHVFENWSFSYDRYSNRRWNPTPQEMPAKKARQKVLSTATPGMTRSIWRCASALFGIFQWSSYWELRICDVNTLLKLATNLIKLIPVDDENLKDIKLLNNSEQQFFCATQN